MNPRTLPTRPEIDHIRCRLRVRGVVQGVGFRPFVHRLAKVHDLGGWVRNEGGGVTIEVEGPAVAVVAFAHGLREQAPPLAAIALVDEEMFPPRGEPAFRILPSDPAVDGAAALIPPDVATCQRCLDELHDPTDRRFGYPFINCTDCGPRFTIVAGVPYDRPLTAMATFRMCALCQAEYDDVASRRHHTQPNACPECGPRVWITDASGEPLGSRDPVAETIERLAAGQIGAVMGLGGFHLACNAGDPHAVRRLRERKRRPEKPLAVMVRDLAAAATVAVLSGDERALLADWRRPIVLLPACDPTPLAREVSGSSRRVGVLLPYTPLHHLLMAGPYPALVMTSGNRVDEPIACTAAEALGRLGGIADFFLLHDRPILQRADDSVARLENGRPLLLRRSRGHVPAPVVLPAAGPPVLALGGDLKNAACLTRENLAFTTQHIGDLSHPAAAEFLEDAVRHLVTLLGVQPRLVIHDAHPDYVSTRTAESLAQALGVAHLSLQHHHAHALACLVEHGWTGPALAVTLDGHGWGPDGTIWGGELFHVHGLRVRRLARLRPLPQPGGDLAAREPWRMALAALVAAFTPDDATWDDLRRLAPFAAAPAPLVAAVASSAVNGATTLTSSAGRLFDAAASLIGLRQRCSFEGQAAMELEELADGASSVRTYALPLQASDDPDGPAELDTRVLLRAIASDVVTGASPASMALGFHRALVTGFTGACQLARQDTGIGTVALSGGVFQNSRLATELRAALTAAGFTVLTHGQVPPNDGGLALGQAWAGLLQFVGTGPTTGGDS